MAKTINDIADSLFSEGETLDKASFLKKVETSGLKIADLSEGDFVTKQKYEDHVAKMKKLQTDYDALKANPSESEQYKALVKERDDWKSKFEETDGKVKSSERKAFLKTNKVKDEFSDFVRSEIEKTVTDTVDFETAAKRYIAEHSQYVEENDGGHQSGLHLNNNNGKTGSVFADLEDLIRS